MKINEITSAINNCEQTYKHLKDMLVREIYNKVDYAISTHKEFDEKYVDRFYAWLKGAAQNTPMNIVHYLGVIRSTKDEWGFCFLKEQPKDNWCSNKEYIIPYEMINAIYEFLEN